MSQPKIIKVVLLGSSGVGKSSILHRYITDEWDENAQTTLGAAFMDKKVTYEGIQFKFQIWDTAGQEKYAPLAQMYYRDANVAILVYDITNRDSLANLKDWQRELSDKGPKDITVAIVGNKCDLERSHDSLNAEGEKYARESHALYAKTSAKQNVGIKELFDSLCAQLIKKMNLKVPESNDSRTKLAATPQANTGQESKGCCG